jgi:hypothetical protein
MERMCGLALAKTTNMKRAVALFMMLASHNSLAAEDVWQTSETSSIWQTECGICHMAFPPALLTQNNWQQMMQRLDKHFGVNASLEPKTRDEIAAFLQRNSGSSWGRSSESLRITETGWFVKRHRSGIAMLEKGRIKSLADCQVCHK